MGKAAADAIDWTAPRLVCIAADFTKYDGHAVQQINRNIELIRYRRFGEELLLLELANATSGNAGRASAAKAAKAPKSSPTEPATAKVGTGDRSFAEWLPLLPPHLSELMSSLEGHVVSLGDDVQRKELKLYLAFKRLKNFATVVPQKNTAASVPARQPRPGAAAAFERRGTLGNKGIGVRATWSWPSHRRRISMLRNR